MVKQSTQPVLGLKIATALMKSGDGVISAKGEGRHVTVHKYNMDVEWAALSLEEDSPPFVLCHSSCHATQDSDIPAAATLEKLHVYHCCPVQLFLNHPDMDRCNVTQKEASVGLVLGTKSLTFQNGAFPVSCGGPYIFRNKTVALYSYGVYKDHNNCRGYKGGSLCLGEKTKTARKRLTLPEQLRFQ